MHTTDVLAQSLTLRSGAVLKNRIAKAAMAESLAWWHAPTGRFADLYGQWASGGAGLLITGNVMIDGRAVEGGKAVVVEDERDLQSLREWADAATQNGTHAWMQINHPGRQALNRATVAPSSVPMKGVLGARWAPRELTEVEILDLIRRFATTAGIAKQGGFTGVQIHAAHGYLISQFLSPYTNRRDDAWGGDPERRRRFLLEVVRAVRHEVGDDFPVSVKLNSADFQRGGFEESESMQVVEALDAAGIDLLEVSGGSYEKPAMTGSERDSTQDREAYFLEYAEKVRGRIDMPLMLTGGFRSGAAMRQAIASGAVEVVGMGRPLALEPDLPRRLLSGEAARAVEVVVGHSHKQLDGMLKLAFAEAQMHRMAHGQTPSTDINLWWAVASVVSRKATSLLA